MKKALWLTLGMVLVLGQGVQAAVSIDRTRVVYAGDSRSVSVNLSNDNKELPFLAQAWLEDEQYQKISGPLVALPPLQRMEPDSKSVVRITTLPEASQLPQDRESLFYFNVREIPPKSEKSNVLQLALQTRVKLFYRPEAIVPKRGTVWQEQLVFQRDGRQLTVNNPTPFYIVMTGLADQFREQGGKDLPGFKNTQIPPFGSETFHLNGPVPSQFVLDYINDYGGHPELLFVCHAQQQCVAQPDAEQNRR